MAETDADRRRTRSEAEAVRAEQKKSGQEISRLEGDEKEVAIARAGELAADYKEKLARADELDQQFDAMWIRVPNIADESAADGFVEEDSAEFKRWGSIAERDYPVRDHKDLGEALNMIDVERAAKVSGTRFGYLTGPAVLIEFGLVRMAFDMLGGRGFTPVVPPVLVRENALFGTGFFPDDDEQVYALPKDDLYLVGTSEVALAALHTDEIFDEEDLPIRYAGFSSCFRREAGAHGKDHDRHIPRPPVRQGRNVLVLPPGPEFGGARIPVLDGRGNRSGAGDSLSGGQRGGGRPRFVSGQEV